MGDYLKLSGGVPADASAINTSAGAGDAGKLPKLNASGAVDSTMMPGGAPVNSSAGAGDAGKLPKLDSTGKIDQTMMPTGVGSEAITFTTSEALAAGDLVNIWNSSGAKARKADATAAGKEAHGFVLASATSGGTVTVYPEEAQLTGLTGLTPGTRMFLSTSPGAATATAPSTSGNVVQDIGYAVSATSILFRPRQPITLA